MTLISDPWDVCMMFDIKSCNGQNIIMGGKQMQQLGMWFELKKGKTWTHMKQSFQFSQVPSARSSWTTQQQACRAPLETQGGITWHPLHPLAEITLGWDGLQLKHAEAQLPSFLPFPVKSSNFGTPSSGKSRESRCQLLLRVLNSSLKLSEASRKLLPGDRSQKLHILWGRKESKWVRGWWFQHASTS